MKYWRKPLDFNKIEVPKGTIHIIENQCKGCGFCVEYCPRDVLEMSTGFNRKGYHPPLIVKENDCLSCQLCEIICPEFAIFVTVQNDGNLSIVGPDTRKEVISLES